MTAQALFEREPVLAKVSAEFKYNKYLFAGAVAAAAGLAFGAIPIMIGAGALALGGALTYLIEPKPSLLKLGATVAVAALIGFGGWNHAQQAMLQNTERAQQAQNEIARQFSAGAQTDPLSVTYDRQSLWTGRMEPNGGVVRAHKTALSADNLEMEVSLDGQAYVPVAYLISARGGSPLSLDI